MTKGKSLIVEHVLQQVLETQLESESRKVGGFLSAEQKLLKRWSRQESNFINNASALLGSRNPLSKKATPKEHIVWLLDNTAYRPIHPYPHHLQPWQAEFVACYFRAGRKDIDKFVANIAKQIGLHGDGEDHAEEKQRIAERVLPFVSVIAPARYVEIQIPCAGHRPHIRRLGPSNPNGISSQIELTGGSAVSDGTLVKTISVDGLFPDLSNHIRFAVPEGWAVISDIDDTIKITQTPDAIGILKTTFAEIPKTPEGMPEFYKILDEQFKQPPWFYLSASPYNLYPFLHTFINNNYKQGTIILRDNSWMYLGGLLQSLTQGTQAYKTDRMNKIHEWLPKRNFICIGDSTQTDPESYAEMYKKYDGWIKAIYIRKVTDAPHMEAKNKPERFDQAFEGVPAHVWRLFTHPNELSDHVKHVAGWAHSGIVGTLQGYFCGQEKSMEKMARIDQSAASE